MTEPPACLASLPVSNRRVLPLIVSSRVVIKKSLKSEVEVEVEGRSREGVCPCRLQTSDFRLPIFLLSDVQPLDEIGVPLRVLCLEIVEQPAAAPDEHQQPAARMVILRVRLE